MILRREEGEGIILLMSDIDRSPTGLAALLDRAIKKLVASSPRNRLTNLGGGVVFDEPLVGFADGDDPIFRQFKTAVGDFHMTPREALAAHIRAGDHSGTNLSRVSVISWILPFSTAIKLSNRRETQVPSLEWNHGRWQGQEVMNELAGSVIGLLRGLGYMVLAPDAEPSFTVKDLPNGRASNWSQRHIAYAAGLGTFSLSDGLITSRGVAMRCGSVVTTAVIMPTPRTYPDHRVNCLFYRDGTCRKCAERCPAGAITEAGHDKIKCREFVVNGQPAILRKLGREQGYIGRYLGCGMCQTGVPCESRIPKSATRPHDG